MGVQERDPHVEGSSQKNERFRTAKEYEAYLRNQGWNVEIREGTRANEVAVVSGGLLECGDGRMRGKVTQQDRGGKNNQLVSIPEGPKLFGGVLFKMKEYGGDQVALLRAIDDVKRQGWVPTVHGDDHGPHHCGMRALWAQGALGSVGVASRLELTPEQIMEIVLKNGGAYVALRDQHVEEALDLNLVAGKTRKADDRRFHVDVWAADRLNVQRQKTIQFSQAAVRALAPDVNTSYIWI